MPCHWGPPVVGGPGTAGKEGAGGKQREGAKPAEKTFIGRKRGKSRRGRMNIWHGWFGIRRGFWLDRGVHSGH